MPSALLHCKKADDLLALTCTGSLVMPTGQQPHTGCVSGDGAVAGVVDGLNVGLGDTTVGAGAGATSVGPTCMYIAMCVCQMQHQPESLLCCTCKVALGTSSYASTCQAAVSEVETMERAQLARYSLAA